MAPGCSVALPDAAAADEGSIAADARRAGVPC